MCLQQQTGWAIFSEQVRAGGSSSVANSRVAVSSHIRGAYEVPRRAATTSRRSSDKDREGPQIAATRVCCVFLIVCAAAGTTTVHSKTPTSTGNSSGAGLTLDCCNAPAHAVRLPSTCCAFARHSARLCASSKTKRRRIDIFDMQKPVTPFISQCSQSTREPDQDSPHKLLMVKFLEQKTTAGRVCKKAPGCCGLEFST